MSMLIPPYLKPGDTIGITCPASKMSRSVAEFAGGVLKSWGFRVVIGKTAGTNFHNFSAPDKIRLQELQQMLDDDTIRAVLFGRGGYGVLRILDQLDFSHLVEYPKWLCGYSDITALHVHVNKCLDMATLHAVMCSGITADTYHDEYVNSLRMALTGQKVNCLVPGHPYNRPGKGEGELTGGNLSLLSNLSGSISQPDTRGKILIIEDTGEYRYNIDRMMLGLKRAGWLDHLQGLLVGSFNESKETIEPFGQTEYEIIWDKVKEYDYPVAFGFPVGHQKENYALKSGVTYMLDVNSQVTLEEKSA